MTPPPKKKSKLRRAYSVISWSKIRMMPHFSKSCICNIFFFFLKKMVIIRSSGILEGFWKKEAGGRNFFSNGDHQLPTSHSFIVAADFYYFSVRWKSFIQIFWKAFIQYNQCFLSCFNCQRKLSAILQYSKFYRLIIKAFSNIFRFFKVYW